MKVKLINDDWSNVSENSVAYLVLKVGDPMPIRGEEYEVIGSSKEGYELAEFDYSNYPSGRLLFKKERFIITDDSFVPNCVYDGSSARKLNFYLSIDYPISSFGKMPRKKKKMLKKYGVTYFKKNN